AALRVQPGFSGSPVCEDGTGRVLGLLGAAPPAGSGDRDSYAVPAERLRVFWPEVFDPARVARSERSRAARPGELTVLHVSDMQFGARHLFGGNGLTPADQAYDTLFQRLHDDLDRLAGEHGLRPDLMVVTGDLAEQGLPGEFGRAFEFLAALTDAVSLPRRHVAVVPGNHDVNRRACRAYFEDGAGEEKQPGAPYWPKWKHFAAALTDFYAGLDGIGFPPDEPWTLFEMPELSVVVAGLNSTIAESHRDGEHHGWLGEHQLRWFARRLADYRGRGWLRLGAGHHHPERRAVLDEEDLRDADDIDRLLVAGAGAAPLRYANRLDGLDGLLGRGTQLASGASAPGGRYGREELPSPSATPDLLLDTVSPLHLLFHGH